MNDLNNKLVPDLSTKIDPGNGKVECLGLVFDDEAKRKEYFKQRLLEALGELKALLKGVPFTSVDDAVTRLSSLVKWPVGSVDQVRELATRMRDGHPEKDLLQRWKDEVGFPHGTVEDILRLSDPPYYTACPNPFVQGFVGHHGRPYDPDEKYHREPYAADVSEGKNDPIYNAHSYHTKVPHKAIMRYILHYTQPGDIVFDGFCGTGMTGVAAQLCGDKKTVESLGYKVQKDGTVLEQEREKGKTVWKPFSKLGSRKAVLNDLSPAATFIAYNYNTPVDAKEFEAEAKRILAETEKECGWMYATLHREAMKGVQVTVDGLAAKLGYAKSVDEIRQLVKKNAKIMGKINYTVWSDVFLCPNCLKEIVFWEAAVDKERKKIKASFSCPHCHVDNLKKRVLERAWVTQFDAAIGKTVRQAKQVPVLINYSVGRRRFEKVPDAFDSALVKVIDEGEIPYWFPTDEMPRGYNTEQPKVSHGMTHVHHFYTRRNLRCMSCFARLASGTELPNGLLLVFTSFAVKTGSLLHNIGFKKGLLNLAGAIPNTLFVPSVVAERNVGLLALNKTLDLLSIFKLKRRVCMCFVGVQSATYPNSQQIADYIFTDPPFGANLMYSELNFLWEAWLKVFTNNKEEAIENKVQGKGLVEYQEIMGRCFQEYYRVLKPGRWMTVAFHNSRNSVWNAIQEALWGAGFVVADVGVLDKQQGTFKQITSSGAVKQDLVISAYKPNEGLEEEFKLEAGSEEGAWRFIRTHLRQLVTANEKDGVLEAQEERRNYLLYDRMVAFHVQRGIAVPLSAAEFYAGLDQRFPLRDGMYFLPDQAVEYDKKRMRADRVQQLALMPRDENSAILWIQQQLGRKPQTFQELHPQFTKDAQAWLKFEKPMELWDLLSDNFLMYDGKGPIPGQIVSWLKLSEIHRPKVRELGAREGTLTSLGLETTDAGLMKAAKDRWYLPDPNRAADLEKVRERQLLKEFEEYVQWPRKRLGVFRLEAVRAGFKKAWQDKDYETIIKVAEKIRPLVLQEDQKLVMWYHQALTRTGRD